jgi:prophage regulatory protein
MNLKLLTFPQLKTEKGIPYCRVHLMRKVELGEFPQPIDLSDRRIAWLEIEVDQWVADRAALRHVKEAA